MRENEQRDWKLPTFGDVCPSQVDWARMAAFIDGEGTILINSRKGRIGSGANLYQSLASTFYLKLSISNTDIRLPEWLKNTFGGSYNNANAKDYYNGRNYKRCYHWNVSANRAAWILYNCLELFVIKREQAEIGIKLQESMKKFTRGAGKCLPKELVEERRELKRNLLVFKARGRTIEDSQAERIKEVS